MIDIIREEIIEALQAIADKHKVPISLSSCGCCGPWFVVGDYFAKEKNYESDDSGEFSVKPKD